MPEPTELHVDAILTNISVQYQNRRLVALEMMPLVKVVKRSDKFFKYDKAERFTIPDSLRGPKSEANEIDWNVAADNYACVDHALREFVSDDELRNADAPIQPEIDAVSFLTELIRLDLEKRIATLLRDTTKLTQNTTLSGTDQWNDYTNSDPISDVETGKAACFVDPNTLLLSRPVFDKLKHHPKITERIKYSQRGIITAELLAELFEIERVVIGAAKYNTAAKGQTASYDWLWGKDAILAYVEPSPGLRRVSLGYTMNYTPKGGNEGYRVRKWRNEKRGGGGFEIETEMDTDEKLVAVDVAYLIKAAVA